MIEVQIPASVEPAALDQIKAIAKAHPGEHELRIVLVSSRRIAGAMVLGPEWRCDGGALCVALLAEFGGVRLQTG